MYYSHDFRFAKAYQDGLRKAANPEITGMSSFVPRVVFVMSKFTKWVSSQIELKFSTKTSIKKQTELAYTGEFENPSIWQ